jgi:tetratricopeptide (TPR) repeat protein
MFTSCEDFVDIDPPNNQLIGTEVFEDATTVDAAFAHIYSQLRENAFTDGGLLGLSYLLGHYTDELTLYSVNLPGVQNYSNNNVLASDSSIKKWWDTSYNLIYATNRILEGVENSTEISPDDKSRFLGEAHFLRGFIHFYLTNLFGSIPYIDSTDYRVNIEVTRLDEDLVYQKIIEDLLSAKVLLPEADSNFENLRPNYWVASALLSRVYLYTKNWQLAFDEASSIITNGSYTLNNELSEVFLKSSTETLWQLDAGMAGNNTREAGTFIFVSGPPPNSAISSYLINAFESGDARFSNWVNSVTDGVETWYYTFKYKLNIPTGTTEECSILFRLAELYLIAAEAQVQLGNLSEALNFLNAIRDRASLAPITSLNQNDVLNSIIKERRIEFFSEQGHRFFDLKRTGRTSSVLPPIKPNWHSTDILFPIPESELILNPNLLPQNEGY